MTYLRVSLRLSLLVNSQENSDVPICRRVTRSHRRGVRLLDQDSFSVRYVEIDPTLFGDGLAQPRCQIRP